MDYGDPLENWRNRPTNYDAGPTGTANSAGNEGLSKASIFQMMLPDRIQQDICNWTNLLGSHRDNQWNHDHPNAEKPRIWKDLMPRELRAFIGLLLLEGVEKARRKPWREMWSTDKRVPFQLLFCKIAD